MSETMNETMNDTTNGTPPKTANDLAIAYEAAIAIAPVEVVSDATPEETVDDAALTAAVIAYEAVSARVTTEAARTDVTAIAATIAPASAPSETANEAAHATDVPFDGLRLRMKVWTDRATGKRYLMPSAFMRDVVRGQPVTDVMYAYAMSDDDTKVVTLTAHEWNALPFFYFKEDGSAPRATSRPVDVVVSGRGSP